MGFFFQKEDRLRMSESKISRCGYFSSLNMVIRIVCDLVCHCLLIYERFTDSEKRKKYNYNSTCTQKR